MIEMNKNLYDIKGRPNQMVFCECGDIVTVYLNVNGEGKARCKCNCDITVERRRRRSKITIFHDTSGCRSHKHSDIKINERAV